MSYEPTQEVNNAERRTAILESLGRKEGDVMEDDLYGEYVLVEAVTPLGDDFPEYDRLYLSDVELD